MSEIVNKVLAAAAWREDQIFTALDGQRYWLKKGGIIALTPCCLVSAPCTYHAQLTHSAPVRAQ